MTKRIAVIGTGVMGRNHARTVHRHPEAQLSYVVDVAKEAAHSVASEYGVDTAESYQDLDGERIDAAIIATPSQFHAEMAIDLMKNGVSVLIEKPVALNQEDANHVAATAIELSRVAMVGHIELFNPATRALTSALGDSTIRRVTAERLGAVADTSRLYHNVVEDLMIHDIAIVMRLIEGDPEVLSAFGRRDTIAAPDPADAHLLFRNEGVDAHLKASRAYPGGKRRVVSVETGNEVVTADLLERVVTRIQAGEGAYRMGDQTFVQDMSSHRTQANGDEPLYAELSFFLKCLRGEASPADEHVAPENALRIMRVTADILGRLQVG